MSNNKMKYSDEKIQKRLRPAKNILSNIKNCSILDIGGGNGHMSKYLLDNGASIAHNFDIIENKDIKDNKLLHYDYQITSWKKFVEDNKNILLSKYNIVIYLGVHDNLDKRSRNKIFKSLIEMTNKYFLFRCERPLFDEKIEEIPGNFERIHKFVWRKKNY